MKFLLAFTIISLSYTCLSQDLECGDLLEQYAIKPDKVEFISCKTGTGQLIVVKQAPGN